MIYKRNIQELIQKNLFKGKVIVLYGPRRVGKTTLCHEILSLYSPSRYVNCEIISNKENLQTKNSEKLRSFLGKSRLIVLDEAQKIKDIGLILKIIVDTFPDIQIIATGSSSFDLMKKASEPLTGRTRTHLLLPLSYEECLENFDYTGAQSRLEFFLRFGSYPGVIHLSEEEAKAELDDIAGKYLYKDIYEVQGLKRTDILSDLLSALALQVGQEVSYEELANLLRLNTKTVQLYLYLLEQCFVIFRLRALSRNPRQELKAKQKFFFYDLGIRNSIIRAYNPLKIRDDIGKLWENYCVVERLKYNTHHLRYVNTYFWRSYQGNEIDYVEEYEGKLHGYEFKWKEPKKINPPSLFRTLYPKASYEVITKENFGTFVSAEN